MKAVVFTLGCKVNECESDSLIAGLIERGYEVSDKLEVADLYIVNTCAVTSEAEKKSRQTASRIKKLNSSAKIIFTGCAVQKNPRAFSEKDGNFLVTGVFGKQKILDMLDWSGEHISNESKVFEELLVTNSLRTRAYVKVQDGCNNFCSYCIIPYLRGRSRSRSPQSILDELNAIKPKEAVINGINLSAYNFEGVDLKGLMDILKDVPTRIRLGSLEARVITDEFLTSLKNLFDFAPHFHLSLQSGSNAVLKSMNRRYTTEEYLYKVNLIRKYFPNAGITTDVIVGFPTETEEEFNRSMEFIKAVEFSDVHAFPFSPRSGTKAFQMPDLSPEIKRERLNKLLEVKRELKENFAFKMKGQVLEMLPEEVKDGYLEGYTENYLRVYLKEEETVGKIIKIRVGEPFKDGALAQKI
ncbi:MAG: tRNA (N(6)-L-threonylcarbamoyladenosine(37)-C(2))-methylthiotransferase MtaB [Clostridia bacterium]|nr:tRNA (N(6)-L-threonylcarbamoyladenosine(37)-C(2))-methylthiotransferase MtaB [Clostridia bacterium]